MSTPLYDALLARAGQDTARFHMPGHKGSAVTPGLRDAVRLDFTELEGTGDLYVGGDVIEEAEALWAAALSADACQFLTCGATQGLYAALLLRARAGRHILVDRACHRAVYHGLALFDLDPVYLPRRQDEPVSPLGVEQALSAHPEIKTVCITSPTYYGVLSDIAEIAAVCHRRGAALLVDGAHGAHLPFLLDDPFRGADLVVTSPHKTLPVYGQGALLFGRGVEGEELRRAAAVAGTSSPSYPVMASLDQAREWMEGEGRGAYIRAAAFVEECRGRYSALTGPGLDPCRLTLRTSRPGEGQLARGELEARGVVPEMADRDSVVCIVTGCDRPGDWSRLEAALAEIGRFQPGGTEASPWRLPPEPERVMSPREALLAPRARLPLAAAEGRIAAETVAPYPPGVPVIAPGERITKKALAYLGELGYNVDKPGAVCLGPDPRKEG